MKSFYILLICFLLFQCSVDKTSSEELTLKDSICYIDTNSSRRNGIDMWRENEPVPVKSLINGKKRSR